MGIYCQNVVLSLNDQNWRLSRKYRCLYCKAFSVPFMRAEIIHSKQYSQIRISSLKKYLPSYKRDTFKIPQLLSVIEESFKLISVIKLSGRLFGNKICIYVDSLKRNLGLKYCDIYQRMIYCALSNLRSKFVEEMPNYYNLLVPYLSEYDMRYSNSLSIIQVDTKNCFYRTMISMSYVQEIFHNLCLPIYFIDVTFHKTQMPTMVF